MIRCIINLLFVVFYGIVSGQELRCNVTVSSSRVGGTNKQVFEALEKDIYEFVNNRKWTDHVYAEGERIECNIFIQVKENISDRFKATIQVQSSRPVYDSSYETTLLNLKDDDFDFSYVQFESLEFDESSNTDALTNIIAYYVYVILGFDYDTFSPQGGTNYFRRAQKIVSRSQSSREKGWNAFDGSYNRYWLTENILNRSYSPFRDLMYKYHRQGLDRMSERPDDARATIAEAIKSLQAIYKLKPDTYINRIFFDAKSDEIIDIFKKGTPDEKNTVIDILKKCDPSNSAKYEKIRD